MDLTRRLSRLDLNLLVALDALLEERHVTRAGRRVGLSQPAMSNALARLRTMLDDPLLVRTPSGMVATPRAEGLAGPVRDALRRVDRALAPPVPFDPTTAHRFRLAVTDYAGCVLLPALVEALAERGPNIDLDVRPFSDASRDEELRTGEVDLAIEYFAHVSEGYHRRKLLEEDFLCVVRADHPDVGKRLSLKRYAALGHILVSPRGGGGRGIADEVLAEHGLERRLAMNIPHFLVAPMLVARSDMIVTLPTRVARLTAEAQGLKLLKTPVDIPGFALEAVWHQRTHGDPALAWFRDLLAEVAAEL